MKSRLAAGRSPEDLRQGFNEESRRRSDHGLLIEGNLADRAVSSSFIVKPLFDADPVRDRIPTLNSMMSSNGNGGDQGGAVEAPAHPKLLVGGAAGSSHDQGRRETWNQDHRDFSNWQGAVEEGLEGLEGFLEGEIDMEDDDPIELKPVEEEVQPAAVGRWQMMARYINLKEPNIDDMSTHFSDVWCLRIGVNFAPLGKNWFTVTFYSEGDFELIARGGPWVYRGYPLLVTKRLENTRPSETILNTVPIWVHVYDLP
jgi:hypothetical protein